MYRNLLESLDKIYPLQRIETTMPYLLDEWQFEIGPKTFVVRSNKIAVKEYGKRVNLITFGVKKGAKNIGTNLAGITNIRQYLATVFSAVEKMYEDPTTKLANKSDGFVLSVPTEIFEKHGAILKRIAKLKFKKIFKMHNSYFDMPDIDDRNALYIWKKEKSFDTVFSNLGVADDSYDELVSGFAKPETAPVKDVVKQMVKTKLEPVGKPVQKDNPIIDMQLVSTSTKTTAQKIEAAKKAGGIDLNEVEFDLRSYLKIAAYNVFFSNDIDSTETKSLDGTTVKFDFNDLLNLTKYEMDPESFSHIIPPETECLLALNLSGIETNHVYDFYQHDLLKGIFGKYRLRDLEEIGLSGATKIQKSLKKPREKVSLEEIVDICLDAKKIISNYGHQITDATAISPGKTASSIAETVTLQEKKKMFYTTLASADPMRLDALDHFVYENSSEGTKTVKGQRYDYSEYEAADIIASLYSDAYVLSEDPKEISKYIDMLPEYTKKMYSEDLEIFEVSFISNWLRTGGSEAQSIAHITMSDFGVNAELNDFYNAGALKESIELDVVRERKDTILSNLEKLYKRSQAYYKDKYKKKYDTKTIKLYRGVGMETIDTYIPGALESWTTNVSTAKLFAAMMAPPSGPPNYIQNTGSVMMSEVPIQDIFGSWDSFPETWFGEEDMKSKKEYIVMGGTFATTPIYIYDPISNKTYGNVQTFKEWSLYEGSRVKKSAIKITTPSMKGFDKILKSGKAALGNDPKEAEVRKIDNEK